MLIDFSSMYIIARTITNIQMSKYILIYQMNSDIKAINNNLFSLKF